MNISAKMLNLLYRQIPPELILERLKSEISSAEVSFTTMNDPIITNDKDLFLDFAESTLAGYTENEQLLLYEELKQIKGNWNPAHLPSSFLIPIVSYARDVLYLQKDTPVCKTSETLNWRDVFLALGQDLFTCAFVAYHDTKNNIHRVNFDWPIILRTDHQELYTVLEAGMAENHNHLKGGTQSFQLTWCRYMNNPTYAKVELRNFKGSKLYSHFSRGHETKPLTTIETIEIAAYVRTILFRTLHRDEFLISDSNGNTVEFTGEAAFSKEYIRAFSYLSEVEKIVDVLKMNYGVKIATPFEAEFCMDYTLEDSVFRNCYESNIRLLVGERFFLYQCMKACMGKKAFTPFEQNLFYLYIILKSNFRSEMIQNNKQVGFRNFERYQDRKDDAWADNSYFFEAVRLGLNARLEEEAIVSLEGRVVPKANAKKNIKAIQEFDRAKRFNDCSMSDSLCPDNYEFNYETDLQEFDNLPYFYTYHFYKVQDKRNLNPKAFCLPQCRHEDHRNNMINAAKGLVTALRESPYLRKRIRGIDAAANEFGCRPEVFAVPYRYIDGVQRNWNACQESFRPSSSIVISKTYHAGEDFLDIAGGLRAIDEAIKYLEMGSGSRIGHALALGVDPYIHYQTKHHELITTKQERLDDLVWILYRSAELGLMINHLLENRLKAEAIKLLHEVYGTVCQENNWSCNLDEYHWSMKLRGDAPSVYFKNKQFDKHYSKLEEIDNYLINTSDPALTFYRNDSCIAGLYYAYHYDLNVGKIGNETYTFKVEKDYMDLMKKLQNEMMYYINNLNIAIESNPSSNVLIGTFGDYENHPVFRFNNRLLDPNTACDQTQMKVSINTDDLGVFDTSLEFEYALLYAVLKNKTDDHMKPLYSDRFILSYLNDLRDMGIKSIFPDNT